MQIRTFRAATIQEALQLVREQLGSDASVLQTREVRKGILTAKRWIEVDAYNPFLPVAPSASRGGELNENDVNKDSSNENAESSSKNRIALGVTSEAFEQLIEAGVEDGLARRLINLVSDRNKFSQSNDIGQLRNQLVELVASQLDVAPFQVPNSHDQRVAAFVGPPGSGKTSVLSKLASLAHSSSRLDVGIVSVDAWRSGSIDALLQQAQLISANVEIVDSSEQLAPALQRLRECDLILIDTIGCSPTNPRQLRCVLDVLDVAQPDEAHLVLGVDTSPAFARACLDAFDRRAATHLDLTKLDEAVGIGSWLSILHQCELPVSSLSYGATWENNLLLATSLDLASILLHQRTMIATSSIPQPTATFSLNRDAEREGRVA